MRTKLQTNLIQKFLVSMLIIFLMLVTLFMAGCQMSNPDQTKENIDEGKTGFFKAPTSVLEMLHTAHDTVYQTLTEKLTNDCGTQPENVWWTLEYETPTQITKINARALVKTNDVSGTIYNYSLTEDLMPDDILDKTQKFKNSNFSKNYNLMFSQEEEQKNKPIADALIEKYSNVIGVKCEDILFSLARVKRPVEVSKTRTLNVVYYTKLQTVKVELVLPIQVCVSGYSEAILNSTQSGITSIKHIIYGKTFFDKSNIN